MIRYQIISNNIPTKSPSNTQTLTISLFYEWPIEWTRKNHNLKVQSNTAVIAVSYRHPYTVEMLFSVVLKMIDLTLLHVINAALSALVSDPCKIRLEKCAGAAVRREEFTPRPVWTVVGLTGLGTWILIEWMCSINNNYQAQYIF